MPSLIKMTESAISIQHRINYLSIAKRLRLLDHEQLMAKMLHRTNLETYCTVCGAVMDTAIEPVDCVVCGSIHTCSPYYC